MSRKTRPLVVTTSVDPETNQTLLELQRRTKRTRSHLVYLMLTQYIGDFTERLKRDPSVLLELLDSEARYPEPQPSAAVIEEKAQSPKKAKKPKGKQP